MAYDLEFEKPLADIEKRIHTSAAQRRSSEGEDQAQLRSLERELQSKTEEVYSHLTAWQTVQVARHKNRPYSLDYIKFMCDDFFELHGDRSYGDDHAIVAGPATPGWADCSLCLSSKRA